jgi:hypothetical protein
MNWTVTYTPEPGRPTYRLRAVSADGTRVIHTDRLTLAECENYDFDADWRLAVAKMQARP